MPNEFLLESFEVEIPAVPQKFCSVLVVPDVKWVAL